MLMHLYEQKKTPVSVSEHILSVRTQFYDN